MSKLDKALSIVFITFIVAALGAIIYLSVTPKEGEKFTEFYLLGVEGKAQDYPQQSTLGEPVDVILGVVNHEYQPATYQVKIESGGIEISQVNIGTLTHEQKWQEKISFTPQYAGERQRFEFYLYRNGYDAPYLKEPLRLYIDVLSP